MTVKLTNNAATTLASSVGTGDTTLVVASGDGALFPTIVTGEWFPVTLVDGDNLEVVRCTERSGDSLTVTRAQEGTAALALPIGTLVELRYTAGVHDENINSDLLRTDYGIRKSLALQPSLVMNFAENEYKLISDEGLADSDLSTLLTTTRASVANRVDHLGLIDEIAIDTPRITYDPVTGECLGLQVGASGTNLATYSEEFDNADWSKVTAATVTANTDVAPDGTTTADTLTSPNDQADQIRQSQSVTDTGQSYTFSFFAKEGTAGIAHLRHVAVGGTTQDVSSIFDFGTETFTTAEAGNEEAERYPDGWWRISASITLNNTGQTTLQHQIIAANESGTVNGNVIAWGAQIEDGTEVTSYTKTTTAAATRNADDISRTLGSEFNPDEPTVFVDFEAAEDITSWAAFSLNDGTTSNRIEVIKRFDGTYRLTITAGGVSQLFENLGTAAAANKILVSCTKDTWGISINGTDFTGALGTLPTGLTTLTLSDNLPLNGTFKEFRTYPRAVSSADRIEATL